MKVGFIGLGTMGASMAYNCLQGGNEMVVHDIRRESATQHLEAGAVWADSPREVAESSEIVFTSLPGPTEVEAVGLGDDGILEGMSEGKVYFDLSTSTPTLIRRIHEEAAARGIHVLDAPVSGGPRGAASRNLAIWVGGDKDVFDRCKPVLDSIGDKAYYVGPIGCGAIAKLVHNCTGYIVQAALAEVFTMGVKAGVEPLALWQAVRKGAQGRRGTFEGLAEHLLPGKFDPPDFALRLARKDVDLAVGVGREYDVPMRLAQLTLQEMTEALNRGWGHRDSRVAMLLQEERSGVEVRVDEALLNALLEEERAGGPGVVSFLIGMPSSRQREGTVIITRLKLTNWRNFTDVDVPLDRAFIIGPNASGKSNLLDAIRFLRDVAKREGGGLQAAVGRRGGVRQIRSLSAHSGGGVGIEVHLSRKSGEPAEWEYRLSFNVERSGIHRTLVQEEIVKHRGQVLLQRPAQDDNADWFHEVLI